MYPETHECHSVEEHHLVEILYHTFILNLWYCVQFQHAKVVVWRRSRLRKEKRTYNSIFHECTSDFQFRAAAFMISVGTRLFISPYPDAMSMSMSTPEYGERVIWKSCHVHVSHSVYRVTDATSRPTTSRIHFANTMLGPGPKNGSQPFMTHSALEQQFSTFLGLRSFFRLRISARPLHVGLIICWCTKVLCCMYVMYSARRQVRPSTCTTRVVPISVY